MFHKHQKTIEVNSTPTRLTALFAALAFFICLAAVQSSRAVTFTVNSTADASDLLAGNGVCETATAGECTLRAAITEANALAGADTINLPAGVYTTTIATTNEDANANGDFDVTQDLNITGAGAGLTIVQANALANTATDRVFHNTTAGVTLVLANMTVENGRTTLTTTTGARGGGIRSDGILTLNAVTVQNNVGANVGGGIYNVGTALNLNNSTVTGNTCAFTTNCFGGGISTIAASPVTSTVNIMNSTVNGNTSTATTAANSGFAAGMYVQNAAATITGSSFNNNTGNGATTGGSNGTGLRVNSSVATLPVTITNSTFNNNVGSTTGANNSGVGIAFNTTTGFPINATLTNVIVNGNTGSGSGGGINLNGVGSTYTLNGCTVRNNSLSSAALNNFGGGIALFGSATGSTMTSTLNINASNIRNNSSTATGNFVGLAGGIYNQGGILNVTNSTVATNNATFHGGIRTLASVLNATTTLNRSTVSGNTAAEGGGIVNIISATTTLTTTTNIINSTISGNSVSGDGGGIEQFGTGGTGITNISNSTVAFNIANNDNTNPPAPDPPDAGGGIAQFTGTVNLRSSIVGRNSVGTGGTSPDILGTVVSGDYNLIQDTTGTVIALAANDITGVDPLLLPLGNYGGPTQTHPLSSTSPAIDKGNAFGTTTDQRGNPFVRPVDLPGFTNAADASDIGAYEIQGPTAASVTVSGRVVLPSDIGLTNARVTLTDSQGNSQTVLTGKLGSFRFLDVAAGETYIISVTSRRYTFAPQIITATEDVTELVFTPQ